MSDFRSHYSPRFRVSVPVSSKASRTKQSDAKSADINFIVSRYKKTGELPVEKRAPMFADITVPDFKEAMDLVASATQSFAMLPASTRAAFDNSPSSLLSALDNSSDPAVRQKLVDAGVLNALPSPSPSNEAATAASGAAPAAPSGASAPQGSGA